MAEATTRLSEFGAIARYFAPLSDGFAGALNLTDDGAVFSPGDGRELVVSTDTLIAGVHFPLTSTAATIAHRTLRTSISDLAAMGATPLTYTLSVALNAGIDDQWLQRFTEALGRDQQLFGIYLCGGDTVTTPGPLTLTATVMGTAAKGRVLTRSGAGAGDLIFVSGTLGDGALGLLELQDQLTDIDENDALFLRERFHRPSPRLALGQRIQGLATACIDISDGLVADLGHLCTASGLSAEVVFDQIPLSDAATRVMAADTTLRDVILSGGDDYELAFAVPSEMAPAVRQLSDTLGVEITEIGHFSASPGGVVVRASDGADITPAQGGYEHF